ncbi:TetR/AcrR family transcriptional regulator [Nocardia sp. NPDC058658]|uniref:TetR/AcrR family transcriptional regulator n=1 Tax=Nocardia sp. NPDC058658 TaxID=3346580 RepID=UPI0036513BF9
MQANPQDRTFTEVGRRAQIVAAAIETIAELGYAHTSFVKIAKRAGLSSPGMISYHFAGKNELTEQVVLELYTRAGAAIGSRVEEAPNVAAALRGYLEANLAFIKEYPTDVRVVADILMNCRGADDRPRYDGADDLVRHLESILRSGQDSGEFRAFATRPMAIVIRAAVDAAGAGIAADPDFDIDSYTAELVTMVELATGNDS